MCREPRVDINNGRNEISMVKTVITISDKKKKQSG